MITVICATVTTLLSPAWPALVVYGLCFAFGLVGMGWNGVYGSEVARLAPANAIGRATGASMFITFSGVFIGPMIFATIYALTGAYTATYLTTAMVALAALFCISRAARALRASPNDP